MGDIELLIKERKRLENELRKKEIHYIDMIEVYKGLTLRGRERIEEQEEKAINILKECFETANINLENSVGNKYDIVIKCKMYLRAIDETKLLSKEFIQEYKYEYERLKVKYLP